MTAPGSTARRVPPRVLLLNGTVGAGKSTTADAVGALLRERGLPHAVVDLDALRRVWPAPPDDRFNGALLARNLAAVARNAWDAGAERLVLAGVAETVEDRSALEEAVAETIVTCRLVVTAGELRRRLLVRHAPGAERDWHLDRAEELDAVLDGADVHDHVVSVDGDDPGRIAAEVLDAVGWGPPVR
ncbi:hypothetical protein DEI81_15575 [Curtobacterium sp. MCBD17_013]|uniref:hypothetical protein n=1 Tax=Curtobacterium sp. MCBD17_013 TaxID=2175668 RepID=UPI000DAA4E7F|nr:hypothetical protein [Curtobacterium sp. MCBD17_013]PZF57219.1 hypothetical protein DEI81_15575 [Curtobacterium sp. MCBD17_013]